MRLLWVLAFTSSIIASGCGPGECGDYTILTPENDAYYAEAPSLRYPREATEDCGADYGSQGNWYPTLATIGFAQAGGRTAATFGDLYMDVSFRTAGAAPGVTLATPMLTGQAFAGLGSSTGHRDVAVLVAGTLTIHAMRDEPDTVFDRKVLELEWDLTWDNGRGASYTATGRDELDFYVMD